MTPAVIAAPDWPRLRDACRRERWQEAFGIAANLHENEAAYRAAYAFIEARKADALAAFIAADAERRARREP